MWWGAGCAGLFAALALAEAGLEPLLIERGDDAERRGAAVARFIRTQARPREQYPVRPRRRGTFSDGKLTTGTKNPAHRLILETFVAAGASRDILWDAKPHVGSDVLPQVVTHIVARIRACGGRGRFRARLIDIERASDGSLRSVTVEHREPAPAGDAGALPSTLR